jgi:hypothetical protein
LKWYIIAICCCCCCQGYASSSSTRSSFGTVCRSATRNARLVGQLHQRRQVEQQQPFKTLEQFMAQLQVGLGFSIWGMLWGVEALQLQNDSRCWIDSVV